MHKPSEDRIHDPTQGRLLKFFKDLVADAEELDLPMMDMVVTYFNEDDDFVPGSYVPELHLVVRRVDAD